jgi:hypothetical protein
MPAPDVEPVLEENPELEPGLFGAKLTTVEAAKHLRVHPSIVCRMAKRGELPGLRSVAPGDSSVHKLRNGLSSRMHGLRAEVPRGTDPRKRRTERSSRDRGIWIRRHSLRPG